MRLVGALLLAALPVTIPAHHSVSANFDLDSVVETAGEITDLSWRNPHVLFELRAESADGTSEMWTIEFTSLTNLRRAGLTGQFVSIGDNIRVAGNPARRGSNSMYAENLLLPNGEEVVLEPRSERRWASQVRGRDGPSGPGDSSAPELGIFRAWSTPRDQPLLLPEDVAPVFDYDLYPLTAAARRSVEGFDRVADSPIRNCVSKGMPTIMEQPYPMDFVQQGDDILLRTEEYDVRRLIHMDPNASDAGVPRSKLGYSIGRWEGDTLVVQTTRLNWPYFDVVGIPQSENSVLLERFTPSEDGSQLNYSLTVTDPANFTEPVTVSKFWVWYPEMTVEPFEFECRG